MYTKKGMERRLRLASAILDVISLGVKPTKRKIIARVGGGINSAWFNNGFEELQELSTNFTKPQVIAATFGLKQIKTLGLSLSAENQKLKSYIEKLELELGRLEPEIASLSFANKVLENKMAEKANSLNTIKQELQTTITNMQRQIDSLYTELSATHKKYAEQAGALNFAVDDKILHKQIEIINLQDKLKSAVLKTSEQDRKISDQQLELVKLKVKLRAKEQAD